MPRTVPLAIANQYAQRATTLCYVVKITRPFDGTVVGFTNHDQDLIVSGTTYGGKGLDVSDVQTSAGTATGNLDLSKFPDATMNAEDLQAGKWDYSLFELAIVNWRSPTDGLDLVKTGYLGQITLNEQGFYVFEFRGLTSAYDNPLGETIQKTCRAELGDSRCTVNLTPYTFNYTIGATPTPTAHVFKVAAATQAADYFTEGKCIFLTGQNAGFTNKIQLFAFGGTFTLAIAPPYPMAAGDTITVIAGCQHRCYEDCRDKFNNILNFQGEHDVPGTDALLADPVT